jgi:hypothetical protein
METFDRDDVNDAVSFLELDPDEPEELMPPYAKGTLMYVNIWRNDVNHVYVSIY